MLVRRLNGAASLCAFVCAAAVLARAQEPLRAPAVPLDPIATIIDAFESHQVIALGEGPHTNEQGHAFRLALIRDPRFAAVVDDIVVESGSAAYQELMDRFVGGEELPRETLREVLENTVVAPPVWDRPIYEEFFRSVRQVNGSLPRERQLRVLLGDPPIDWSSVHSAEEYRQWLRQRDSHPADLIRREVLARNRRALVIYGDGHLQARSERPGRSLVGILETGGARTFAITTTFADLARFQPDVASWRTPSLALLRGTLIGAAPYEFFFGPPPPVDYFRANPHIDDHFDAVLYLGPHRSMASLAYPRCAAPEYVAMRVGRMLLAGSPPTVADRLAAECTAAAPKP